MTDPNKNSPVLEAVLIATLTSLCTGVINLVLEEIKSRRKKKLGLNDKDEKVNVP